MGTDQSSYPATSFSTSSYQDLLPPGYLSTDGNQIVDAAGADMRIASVGWNQNITDIPAQVAEMAQAGFNTIRISWDDADLTSDVSLLKQVVAAAGTVGMKVIIDHHNDEGFTNPADGYGAQQKNGLWYDLGPGTDNTNGAGVAGTVTQAKFQADWVSLAKTFAGNPTVIGFDLDNEPTAAGNITWGPYGPNGGYGPTDIHAMYQSVGDAIQAVDPGALIIAEGPENYNGTNFAGTASAAPGGDLSVAAKDPVALNVPDKVVYSVHDYPTEITGSALDSGPQEISELNADWGYLETGNIAPVWVGEMGSSMVSANSQAWAATLLGYMNGKDGARGGPTFTGSQQPVSGDWWVWGYLPGENPDGILNADGSLNPAQYAVWSQLLPVNTETAPQPSSTPPSPSPVPSSTPVTLTGPTTGSGPDTLTIGISQDAYQGSAKFVVDINGKKVGGTEIVMSAATKSSGAMEIMTFLGTFTPNNGVDTVKINFTNDLYGGPAKDRNLYVESVKMNGIAATTQTAALYSNGSATFKVPIASSLNPLITAVGSLHTNTFSNGNWIGISR